MSVRGSISIDTLMSLPGMGRRISDIAQELIVKIQEEAPVQPKPEEISGESEPDSPSYERGSKKSSKRRSSRDGPVRRMSQERRNSHKSLAGESSTGESKQTTPAGSKRSSESAGTKRESSKESSAKRKNSITEESLPDVEGDSAGTDSEVEQEKSPRSTAAPPAAETQRIKIVKERTRRKSIGLLAEERHRRKSQGKIHDAEKTEVVHQTSLQLSFGQGQVLRPAARQLVAPTPPADKQAPSTLGQKWKRVDKVASPNASNHLSNIGKVASADKSDASSPKVFLQGLWRDLRGRVNAEQEIIRNQHAATLQFIAHQQEQGPEALAGDPWDHICRSELARLDRLAKLGRQLQVLGYHGADVDCELEQNTAVVAPLRRNPEQRPGDSRFSLKMPEQRFSMVGDSLQESALSQASDSSLLAKQLQRAYDARLETEEDAEPEQPQLAVESPAHIQSPVRVRPSLLPYIVDDIRVDLGLDPLGKRKTLLGQRPPPTVGPHFSLRELPVQEPLKPSTKKTILPALEVESTYAGAQERWKQWTGLQTSKKPRKSTASDRLSKRAQEQTSLHLVTEECVTVLCDFREEVAIEEQRAHGRSFGPLVRSVRFQLDALVKTCSAFAKQAGALADVLSLTRVLAEEDARHLRKARMQMVNDGAMAASKSGLRSRSSSPRPPASLPVQEAQGPPPWIEKFWQVSTSFAKLDDLAVSSVRQAGSAIEDIGSLQDKVVALMRKTHLDCLELVDVSLAICFEDAFDEVKVSLLELFCGIFGDMAFVVFLSDDVNKVPKRLGESLYKPKSHLHSGADVQWNTMPHRVLTWAMTCPVPVQDGVDVAIPSPPRQHKDAKMYMRRGISGWTCVQVTGPAVAAKLPRL